MSTPLPEPGSFLLQFQELHADIDDPSVVCGTQTITAAPEERDQDRHAGILYGTQTETKTIEGPDQDPPRADYFAIPRA